MAKIVYYNASFVTIHVLQRPMGAKVHAHTSCVCVRERVCERESVCVSVCMYVCVCAFVLYNCFFAT